MNSPIRRGLTKGTGPGDRRRAPVALLAALFAAAGLHAADFVSTGTVRWVDQSRGSDDTGDGSEARPYKTVNKAVFEMMPEDIVRIAPGVYTLSETIETDPEKIPLTNNDRQYAHLTFEGTDPDDRPVIDGDGRLTGMRIDGMGILFRNLVISNCYTQAKDVGAALVLDCAGWGGLAEMWRLGYKFVNCDFVACTNANPDKALISPGVMRMKKGIFEGCLFADNYGSGQGGAVHNLHKGNEEGHQVYSNCTFRGNTAELYGGALSAGEYPCTTVYDCRFEGNSVRKREKCGEATGGAIYGAITAVSNCTFSGNYAYGGGGAIYARGAGHAPSLVDCRFVANACEGDNWYPGGGAVYLWSGGALTNCLFSCNTNVLSNGGGLYAKEDGARSKPLSCFRCSFSNNVAAAGGGLYSAVSNMTVRNSLFARNLAKKDGGAAALVRQAPPLLEHSLESCTFAENASGGNGAALYARCVAVGVTNALFAANTAKGVEGVSYADAEATIDLDHCFVSGDPKFADAPGGDYSLRSSSPCRNAGRNLPWMEGASDLLDRPGKGRVAEGTVDVGCCEFWPLSGLVLVVR